MPWVRFVERFDYHVRHNVTISYKVGNSYLVSQGCADEALKSGKAVSTERKNKKHAIPAGR